MVGIWKAVVTVGKRSAWCEFCVLEQGRSLLGRNALKNLRAQIDCAEGTIEINQMSVQGVEQRFGEVFSGELGRVKGFEHKVKERRSCIPVQQKVRRLPLAIREAVREEIMKLEKTGVIKKIDVSEWISALVVVAKRDGRVRVCVDLTRRWCI